MRVISAPQRAIAPCSPPSPLSERMLSSSDEASSRGCPVFPSQTGQQSGASDSISFCTVSAVKSGMSTGVKRMRSHLSRR